MQQLKNIEEIENAINEYGEVVVSKNQKNKIVIMSMEEYKKRVLQNDIEEHLLKSEQDIENGRVQDARKVFEEWKEKYEI
jgi:PHD/YefM family antitoxin component YafN of YafNO toxin-antitoxin module